MLRLGNHLRLAVKERAGEIQPLLDVGGKAASAQRNPHLLWNRRQQPLEDLKFDGVHQAGATSISRFR